MAKPKLTTEQELIRRNARTESLKTVAGLGRKWVFAQAVCRLTHSGGEALPMFVFDTLYDVPSLIATVSYATAFGKTREYADRMYDQWNIDRVEAEKKE